MVLTEAIGGALFLCLGLVGEYLGRMFMVIMNHPQSTVREYLDGRDFANKE